MAKRKSIAETGLTDHELRILRYLDQRGATDRATMVPDLAGDETRLGRNGGRHNGSNGAIPLIAAAWCRRLIAERLVQTKPERIAWTSRGREISYYRRAVYEITADGRQLLRTVPHAS